MLSHRLAVKAPALRRLFFSCGIFLLAVPLATAQAPDWRKLWGQTIEAHEKKDYAAYRSAMYALFDATHGHSEALFGLAKAEALNGNRREALRWLRAYAHSGLYRDIAAEADLASLRNDPEFAALKRDMDKNRVAVSGSQTWLELPEDLIPEDIAFDESTGRFLVTSIRHRKVIWIDAGRKTGDWLSEGQDGLWGVLGIAIDQERKLVWITTEAIPHALGYREEDKNRSALLAYGLNDRRLRKRLEIPDRSSPHELGDLTLAPDGTVYVSDGKAGRLYRATIDSPELELVSSDFGSPQGPTLSVKNDVLYVADYVMGVVAVDVKKKTVSPLKHPVHLPLNGIDCLLRHGRQLIAVQNGNDPVRVMLLQLDDTGSKVTGSRVVDASPAELGSPTHGVIRGKRFYYLANTGLDNFDQNGKLAPGKKLSPARVMYFDLE